MSNSGRVWTVLTMLEWATTYFSEKNVPDPRLSIEWILADALGIKRLDIYLQYDRPLSSAELDKIRPLVKRRATHEPLQYITGTTDFMGVTINVTPDVLIPRIETEQLTDLLLEHTKNQKEKPLRLLDIGTGSGCIPVAVKQKRPEWYCAGADISEKALKIARENARLNDVDVHFFRGDIRNLPDIRFEDWDLIISNPPYITEAEKKNMHPQVLEHEPSQALFHDDPVKLYRKIIKFAAEQNARLFLECNHTTAEQVAKIASIFFNNSELLKDLDNNNRFVIASDGVTNVTP